jgi:hypothetical protein
VREGDKPDPGVMTHRWRQQYELMYNITFCTWKYSEICKYIQEGRHAYLLALSVKRAWN